MAENPVLEAAQTEIGPLPAWQWGALAGVAAIALRMILPPKGKGSFFRRAAQGSSDAPTVGAPGIDRRPVAPFAGLAPSGGGQAAFMPSSGIIPGITTPAPFLSVTTPEGASIGGEGLSAGDLVSILGALIPTAPPSATVNVPPPVAPPPAAPPPPRYLPLSPSSIRALFRDYPVAFRGDPEYWVRGFLGIGTPGVTAARPTEWPNFWSAYARTGLPR